jgi:hypothetical protein
VVDGIVISFGTSSSQVQESESQQSTDQRNGKLPVGPSNRHKLVTGGCCSFSTFQETAKGGSADARRIVRSALSTTQGKHMDTSVSHYSNLVFVKALKFKIVPV